jgi:anti-sigma regulatory factor (Ser/Thr protein kinase)
MKKVQLIVPGRFNALAQIADFVDRAGHDAGFADDDIYHVQMAVDEACSNIIEHAYSSRRGDINLACAVAPGGDFIVTIRDTGIPFDPQAIQDPLKGATLEEWSGDGLGLYFIRRLMDDVRFEFDPVKGNTLTLIKRRAR